VGWLLRIMGLKEPVLAEMLQISTVTTTWVTMLCFLIPLLQVKEPSLATTNLAQLRAEPLHTVISLIRIQRINRLATKDNNKWEDTKVKSPKVQFMMKTCREHNNLNKCKTNKNGVNMM